MENLTNIADNHSIQRRIQNPEKHLRWSFFTKIVND